MSLVSGFTLRSLLGEDGGELLSLRFERRGTVYARPVERHMGFNGVDSKVVPIVCSASPP